MLRGYKFDFTRHPMAKRLEKSSIEDHVPEWRRRKEAESHQAVDSWAQREIEREKAVILKEDVAPKTKDASRFRQKAKSVSQKKDFLI